MQELIDPRLAETRVLFAVAEAEFEQRAQWRASALTFRAIDEVLREAKAHPEVFVDEQMLRGDEVELAVRAAVADLAVRLNQAESTIMDNGSVARMLRQRLPRVWGWFIEGEISTQNAREAASTTIELPAECWAALDDEMLEPARTLTPPRFRAKARALREKLHATSLAERRELAQRQRRVYTEVDRDGMGWLHAYLPVEQLGLAQSHVDALAFGHFREADETRTMSQLRADVLADLLTGVGTPSKPTVSVALTIPAQALLGGSSAPALLEGVGPIDLDVARELAATAPSFTRLLTDPFSDRVLQLDPRQYRVTAAMKRWLRATQPTCDFPGCGRRSANCDLDHTVAYAGGGPTSAANLSPRCRKHHTLKHQTRWKVEAPATAPPSTAGAASGRARWTSPTGYQRDADPPPF